MFCEIISTPQTISNDSKIDVTTRTVTCCSVPDDACDGRSTTDQLRPVSLGLAHSDAQQLGPANRDDQQPGTVPASQAPPDGGRHHPAATRRLLPHRVRLRPSYLPVGLPQPEGPQAPQRHLHAALARRHHDVPLLDHVAVLITCRCNLQPRHGDANKQVHFGSRDR